MDIDGVTLNKMILEALKRTGFTQSEVARRASISRDAMSRYSTGKTRPPPEKLAAIAHVLGVRPADLDPTNVTRGTTKQSLKDGYMILPDMDRDDGLVRLQVDMQVTEERLQAIMKILEKQKADQRT